MSGCIFCLDMMERSFSKPATGDEEEVPEMRIGELAERTGASVRSLRHYERAGLVGARRDENGYRVFDSGAIECVRRVRGLLDAGFTISEILPLSACLVKGKHSEPCSVAVADLYRQKLDQIDRRIRCLQEIRALVADRAACVAEQDISRSSSSRR
jgi:MerR family copper efflux transcriptional regulator